jgi:hypothetical protein
LRLTWLLAPAGLAISAAAAYLALRVVPLGPELSSAYLRRMFIGTGPTVGVSVAVAAIVCALVCRGHGGVRAVVGVAAVLAGTLLLTEVAIAGGGVSSTGTADCATDPRVWQYLGTLRKDAVIAGDPLALDCVTIVSKRPVVISRKLYQVFSAAYLNVARPRMFAMIEAYFGTLRAKIIALRRLYGAGYLVVQPGSLRGKYPPQQWYRMAPFGGIVTRLMHSSTEPAALDLPARCRTWHDGQTDVYALNCVARSRAGRS